MALRILTWLIALGSHCAFALFMFLPSGDAALEQGLGEDIMVVEQGFVIEGFAKLGQDFVTIEPIEAPPVQMAAAQPLPEEVKPVQEQEVIPLRERPEEVKLFDEQSVITSALGPEQENVTEAEPKDVTEPEPELAEVEQPKPEVVEKVLPQQVATLPQQSAAAQQESSGAEKKGGDTTNQSAYLGKLRFELERSKVNPRTTFVGTAVVRFRISADGEVISREIVKSSGSKVLDDAALASIEKASPFPPIPKDLQRQQLEVSVPFKFRVR